MEIEEVTPLYRGVTHIDGFSERVLEFVAEADGQFYPRV